MSFRTSAALLLMLLMWTPSTSAQESRGMIFGSVTDPSAAAITGAKVVVTNIETAVSQPYQTNNTGYYEASLLNAGKYRLTVEAPGFKKAVRESIELPVGTRLQVNFTLELGNVSESVTVSAEAPLLDTTGVSTGQVIDNRVLQDLTLSGQNAVMAAKLAPGIQSGDTVGDVAGQPHSVGAGSRMYVAGGVGGNEFYIDGNPNGGRGRTVGYMPSAELIQEMKVETSGFDASIGHTTGVNITMMTKVGTNALHGSARFAHRQDRWGALGFFQKQAYYRSIAQAESQGNTALARQLRDEGPFGKSTGRLSSWAGTLGGPVIVPRLFNGKNKLFFFVGMDGFGQGGSYFGQNTLPSMADRQGNFAPLLNVNATLYQIYDPLTVRPDPARPGHFVRDALPGNVLPASRIVNPAYKFYSLLMPAPNVITDPKLDPVRNFEAVGNSWNRYKSVSNREDYHLSDKNRFFARWHWGRWDNWVPGWGYASPAIPAVDVYGYMRRNRAVSVDWVNTLSSATVLNIAVSATQYTETQDWFGIDPYKPSDVGLPSYMDAKAGDRHHLPIMSWSGYNNVGGQAKTEYNVRTMSLKADLSHVRSSHTLRAGANLRGQHYTNNNPGVTSGAFSFSNTWTQRTDDGFTPAGSYGHSWAAFMMGLPSSL